MSDSQAAAPDPTPDPRNFLRTGLAFLRGDSLVARSLLLGALTLLFKLPLDMVGNIVADRQNYESQAEASITENWGTAQVFSGPMIHLGYRAIGETGPAKHALTLLPEKLIVTGSVVPEQRRRGLFAVTVYAAKLDVVAEFQTKALRDRLRSGDWIDFASARLGLGLTDATSIDISSADIAGRSIVWVPNATSSKQISAQAPLGGIDLDHLDTVSVHLQIAFNGSRSLSILPLGGRTEANITSSWPSPSFIGKYLPTSQQIGARGFDAKWSVPSLGRGYDQLWDSGTTEQALSNAMMSAFGFTLINPVDAYRETNRAIKYALLIIGLTFAAGQVFELGGSLRQSIAQNGLIGLALCVFYLLLLSLGERIGFGAAYVASAGAVVAQAAIYNWSLYRRRRAAVGFGLVLTGLYASLYTLLQLEDMALLCGSVMLFILLSLAMRLTRNMYRTSSTAGLNNPDHGYSAGLGTGSP